MDRMRIELTSETLQVFLAEALEHASPFERVVGLKPTTSCLEGRSSNQLSYTRSCDYSLGSFVTFYVNEEASPTNITGVGCPTTISPKRQFLSSKTE